MITEMEFNVGSDHYKAAYIPDHGMFFLWRNGERVQDATRMGVMVLMCNELSRLQANEKTDK